MDEDESHNFYEPKMDRPISYVGVKFRGALNMRKFQRFLGGLIGEEESEIDILRILGVPHIAGDDRMFVPQCVHMLQPVMPLPALPLPVSPRPVWLRPRSLQPVLQQPVSLLPVLLQPVLLQPVLLQPVVPRPMLL